MNKLNKKNKLQKRPKKKLDKQKNYVIKWKVRKKKTCNENEDKITEDKMLTNDRIKELEKTLNEREKEVLEL